MTLPISVIKNTLGYLQCDISAVINHLNILEGDNPQDQKDQAELKAIESIKYICQMVKTIEKKADIKTVITGYTDAELKDKGII